MINYDFNYNEVLNILQEDKYKNGNNFVLDEQEDNGKIELNINSNNNLFAISLSHKNSISVFKHKKVADWIVLEFLDDSFKNINLHLFELKKTINYSSWQKIKEQFKGAYEHSFLLKGLFNYKINSVICYSAFIYDKLKLQNTTNPTLLKKSLGNDKKSSSIDWNNKTIRLYNNKHIQHIKISLKPGTTGKGSYEI